MTKNSH